MKKIAIISGARPNLVKILPLCAELKKQRIPYFNVYTGQHFSDKMSAIFFDEFGIKPDYTLLSSKKSVLKQFSNIIVGLEKILLKENPSLVIVVGDVNSTLAGALVAHKLNLKLAHVEAGLRSYNPKMLEEMNRVITDRLAHILFTSSKSDIGNLKKEGIVKNIYFVGNIMIDTLKRFSKEIENKKPAEKFYFCTLHRAENVDDKKVFTGILDALEIISRDCKIYFPLHPRTRKMVKHFGLHDRLIKIFTLIEPLNYKNSLYFQKNAELVLTDSGGVQEESSYLGTPCLTVRTETERPVTLKCGTNTLAGISKSSILEAYNQKKLKKLKTKIPLWDGKTSERIVRILKEQNYV